MNKKITIVYMSFSGNVRSFTHRLQEYAAQQNHLNNDNPVIELLEISEQTIPVKSETNFFVILPTYMVGGSKFTPTLTEILTNPMRDYLETDNNIENCLGFIGSGNLTLGKMFVITAKTYARDYNLPLLAAFESRGTTRDIERIYKVLTDKAFEK
ncbi:class Ib ribonucleoside-diphosphate reductase assembly flavoprotein NrdI [Limosilactobacillus rudii]|nr:class Ib ribonucleoside-diphosphate reductase assembly flavoprotein NrdI [Limosilactobacillus rudii]MCD7135542.1 class Ib ribonucleoside-diphosphate reductase assembly flavoprotein NrdI [Limosilactobacillus rudii]